jgi:hypothetical protein
MMKPKRLIKQRNTHFKKLQNGLEKPPRSQNGSHSLLIRTPVTPPSVVAHQNFRIRCSYHRAPRLVQTFRSGQPDNQNQSVIPKPVDE